MKVQGNRLRVLRAEHDITQMEIAKRTGIQVSRYWRIEHGYEQPTRDELEKLAQALQVKPRQLGIQASEECRAS